MAGLALFDMDDTLVRRNTAGVYFRDRYRQGLTGRREMLQVAWVMVRYKLNTVDMARLAGTAARSLAGQLEADLVAVCAELYRREVRSLICPEALAALRMHQARGDVCAIVTASSPYLARPLAAELGIPEVLCTELEVANGRFTGQLRGEACFGEAKVRRAEALAAKYGLALSAATFYTDSHSDLPLLSAVGSPRIVRPDPRLRLHAWRLAWPVLPW